MPNHLILTGGSGFIGLNLIKFFESKQYNVHQVYLRNSDWKKIFPQKGEAIFHLAGKAHDTSDTSEAKEYFEVNTNLTKEVFKCFLDSEVRDFFYFSSIKAVADSVDGVLSETTVCNPLTPYGQSKLSAENYLLSKPLPAGKRLFVIRPCMVHGPGNKGNLNLLYSVIKKGLPWPLAAFDNQRSFLSIENLFFVLESLLKNTVLSGGTFNIADDEPISTNEIIQLISKQLNKKPLLWKVPPSLVHCLARIGDVIYLPLNSDRLKKLTENYVVSNQKIKEVLGLKILPINAIDGMRATIQSFTI